MKIDIFSRRKHNLWPSHLNGEGADPDHMDESPAAGAADVHAPANGDPHQQAHALPNDTVESREERVARLRQQVRSGTYEIPVAQLVKALTALILRRR